MQNETCRETTSEVLLKPTLDRHRALRSLIEELEAVDGYDHWIQAAHDSELKSVLSRCRDRVKEQAAMLLEWIRCRDPELDSALSSHLFKKGAGELGVELKASLANPALDALSEPVEAPLFDSDELLDFSVARRR